MLAPMPAVARPIVFVSDFGLGNEWVGICHSVLAGISPRGPVVDPTHPIPPLPGPTGAAHLAAGVPLERLGPTLDPAGLVGLTLPEPEISDGEIRGEVLDFNRFGNIQLNVRETDLSRAGLVDAPVLTIKAVAASADARRG